MACDKTTTTESILRIYIWIKLVDRWRFHCIISSNKKKYTRRCLMFIIIVQANPMAALFYIHISSIENHFTLSSTRIEQFWFFLNSFCIVFLYNLFGHLPRFYWSFYIRPLYCKHKQVFYKISYVKGGTYYINQSTFPKFKKMNKYFEWEKIKPFLFQSDFFLVNMKAVLNYATLRTLSALSDVSSNVTAKVNS